MSLASLNDILVDELRSLHSVERQIVEALPQILESVYSKSLKDSIEDHLDQSEEHAVRLESVAKVLGIKLSGKTSEGMEALIAETTSIAQDGAVRILRDGAIISALQKIEHYEIAAYGTVRSIAESLGYDEVVELLQTTLDEELSAEEKLTSLFQSEILDAEGMDELDVEEDDEVMEDLEEDTGEEPLAAEQSDKPNY